MVRPETGPESAVTDRIIRMLEDGPRTPAGWRQAMAGLAAASGPEVYAVLFFVLAQLDFAPDKAHEHWLRVLRQWEELNRRVPEKVDLRVARRRLTRNAVNDWGPSYSPDGRRRS